VEAARIRARRGSLESEKDPDGRLHVRAYDYSSGAEPRPEGESAAFVSDRAETSLLPGEREGPLVEGIVRGRMKPTYRVQLRAWLLLRTAIRDRTKGRDGLVAALRPLVVLRHADVARRVGFGSGSPGRAAAERFLERRGHVTQVTVGTKPGAFVVTDTGMAWLEQDRWARPLWQRAFR
jgi:hypothetical protein